MNSHLVVFSNPYILLDQVIPNLKQLNRLNGSEFTIFVSNYSLSESLSKALLKNVHQEGIRSVHIIPHYKNYCGRWTKISKRNYLGELIFLAKYATKLPKYDTLFLHSSNSSFESWFLKFSKYNSTVYLLPTLPRVTNFQISSQQVGQRLSLKDLLMLLLKKANYSFVAFMEFLVDLFIWKRPRIQSLNRNLEYSHNVTCDVAIVSTSEVAELYSGILQAREVKVANFDNHVSIRPKVNQLLIILGGDINKENATKEYFELARRSINYFINIHKQLSQVVIRPHPRSNVDISESLLEVFDSPNLEIVIDRESTLLELVGSSFAVLSEFSSVIFRIVNFHEVICLGLDAQMKTIFDFIPWPSNLTLISNQNSELVITSRTLQVDKRDLIPLPDLLAIVSKNSDS